MASVQADENASKKKFRKRTKQLCKHIKAQMEFYFGDANLGKDRFLKKEIDKTQDGWLDVSLFTKFNKLRKLTSDVTLIAKALRISDLIQVSEDGSKLRRKKPIVERKDVDERTIYVDCLPPTADHNWVRSVFEPYGEVTYVSLPRFQSTTDFKGFAFVEFGTLESATRAANEMNNPPSLVQDNKFYYFPHLGNKAYSALVRKKHKLEEVSDAPKRTRTISEPSSAASTIKLGKRSRNFSETDTTEASPSKKSRMESGNRETDDMKATDRTKVKLDDTAEVITTTSKKTKVEVDKNTLSEDIENGKGSKIKVVVEAQSETSENDENESEEKKKRRHRNKKKKDEKSEKEEKTAIPELRVMSKADWLILRQEYLDMQKQNMRELKTALQEHREEEKVPEVAKEEPMTDDALGAEKQTKAKSIEFVPNVIVRVESHVPMKRGELKEKVKKFGEVCYLDVENDSLSGYIRCGDAATAAKLADAHVANHVFSLVTGEAEERYWEKLAADREHKLSAKPRDKRRGKQKLEAKAEVVKKELKEKKHIVFGD